jgi:predicted metalloendopeptidase
VRLVDELLGEALGQVYVKETLGAEGKARVSALARAVGEALAQDITGLAWMSEATRRAAEQKLAAITAKIGYPEHWRDYGALAIARDDLFGNVVRGRGFEVARQLKKIGGPVDRAEWHMTPATVNAYYSASQNNINFPAGILQPPFFDRAGDEAANYGGIGSVIGHEMTHGFDDQGSKFDAQGNLRDWWSAADRGAFDERAQCFVDEYGGFVAVDNLRLNGKLTLGENIADNGGVHLAGMALRTAEAAAGGSPEKDGFTAEQRFYLGYAQLWCENRTPQSERLLVRIDPHSPGRYRVTGVLRNDADFARAFNCKSGDRMVAEQTCRVW